MKTNIQSRDFPLRFRKEPTMNIRLIIVIGLAVCSALWAMLGTARGQIFASINGNSQNGGGSIFQYTSAGAQSPFVSNLDRPRGMVFDSSGNLFVSTNTRVAGGTQGSILKITPGGLMSTFATLPLNFFLAQLAIDGITGNVFVDAANENDSHLASTIYEVTPGGTVSAFGLQSDCIQSDGTNCSVPSSVPGLAIDSSGNLFVMSGRETNDPALTPLPPAIYTFTTTPAVVTKPFRRKHYLPVRPRARRPGLRHVRESFRVYWRPLLDWQRRDSRICTRRDGEHLPFRHWTDPLS